MKKIIIIIGLISLLCIIIASCSDSGSSSHSHSSGGNYGYGSKYDRDVDYVADVFGTDSDSVNDVCNALGNAMK